MKKETLSYIQVHRLFATYTDEFVYLLRNIYFPCKIFLHIDDANAMSFTWTSFNVEFTLYYTKNNDLCGFCILTKNK